MARAAAPSIFATACITIGDKVEAAYRALEHQGRNRIINHDSITRRGAHHAVIAQHLAHDRHKGERLAGDDRRHAER